MAKSNSDRINEALDLLVEALGPVIDQVLLPLLPPGVDDWPALLAAKDDVGGKSYERTDPQVQLRVFTERLGNLGFPFGQVLSRAEQNLAGEMRDVRDKWAHKKPFSADDAYRALDTCERLLRAINAPTQADGVRKLRLDVQRAAYSEETRRDTRNASAMPALAAADLAPWREVLRPHADIASGDFARAEFAADLHQVSNGIGTRDYTDPVEFFARTYLTDGLRTLLTLSARRLAGDLNAAPVINLQTTFGGGKTHSMLAVWHLFSGNDLTAFPQDVQGLLHEQPADLFRRPIKRVAIVGNELAPGQAWRKPDGTVVHTLWGELAWQLGGAEGYALVADADSSGTNPGAALRDLIVAYSPALILIDEWVAYARGLYGRDDLPGGSFETQFTFAQQLTEVVKSVPGALLLVSIPASDIRRDGEEPTASDLEVGGANGRAALERLQNVVSRVAQNWTPASSQESFEIVRRRLFVEPNADARRRIDATARQFSEFYRKQTGELPAETRSPEYEARIRAAYPIHPELFDRLYGDWSTLERFQRTRGVLRLMSAVVHALHVAEDDSPLIMPGSMPLASAAVRDEVSSYLDDAWKAIIETDIDGENATPVHIDRERPLFGARALTRRIARTLFMGSAATLGSTHKGIERQKVFLGVAMPGDTIGNFGSALQMLGDRSTYLYAEGQRYWFDRQPSLNRMAGERASSLNVEDVYAEAVRRLKLGPRSTPEFTDVVVAPLSTSDLAESESCRLVITHPLHTHNARGKESTAWSFALDLARNRGGAPRQNANTFVVLAADEARWSELDEAIRTYLAWKYIASSVADLDLTASQAEQARTRSDEANRVVDQRVAATWIWALYPVQPNGAQPLSLETKKIESGEIRLATRTGERLAKDDVIFTQSSPRSLALELRLHLRTKWNDGRISVGELWEYHVRYPYLARLKDKAVLIDAIRAVIADPGWSDMGFALASGYDEQTGDFIGLRVPIYETQVPAITDDTLLVAPHLAEAQRARDARTLEPVDFRKPEVTLPGPGGVTGSNGGSGPVGLQSSVDIAVANARYTGVVELRTSENLAAQLKIITEEILVHLQNAHLDTFEVQLTVNAGRREGFDTDIVRTVTENSRTLGFVKNRFEEL
ncbi:Swt1 family HEPN domain-containing protein [Cryobacterium sp. TMT2-4]|uniref:Swt1 family HEPN domain-containing protein n=1 Tax=Cryobacterium sp. TMT2-4 TaxID=1259254 RepID=UPI001069F987|nr:Swt1 family HEPN domain-containing protein [Cryobacterium sp. TMT2-4]TFC67798.1 ATP-binding protein [Cryobacterium sp. TMT2-4]